MLRSVINHLDVYQKNQDFWNFDFLKLRWKFKFSFAKLEFWSCCVTPDCSLFDQNLSFGFTNSSLEDALKFAALCNPKTWVLYLQTRVLTLLSLLELTVNFRRSYLPGLNSVLVHSTLDGNLFESTFICH